MKTKLLIFVSTFLLVLMPIISSAGGLQELSVAIGPERNLPSGGGNNIDVAIMAKDIENISSIQLSLKYNPEVLVVDNIAKGDINDVQFSSNTDQENGNIIIEIVKDTGFSLEEGSIANIKFIITGGKGKSSTLNLGVLKVLDISNANVNVPTITNAEYTFGRERIISPPDNGIKTPTVQETTPQDITPQETTPKESPGFGILVSAFIMILIVLLRKR